MTWTKTGDEFSDECWTLSDPAYRLHHEGLTWSNRKALDGQLAKDDMRRWARRPEAAEELVNVGWWEDHGQHYQIIHHIGYQRTQEQLAHQSIVNSQNGRKGGRPRKQKTKPLTESLTETESNGDRTGQASTGSTWDREKSDDTELLCTNGCDAPAGFGPGGIYCQDCVATENTPW
jgi:hypothetical protein